MTSSSQMRSALSGSIYSRYYARPSPLKNSVVFMDDRFMAELSRANGGSGTVDSGWRRRDRGSAIPTYTKGEFGVIGPTGYAGSGSTDLHLGKEFRYLHTPYYYALGNACILEHSADPVHRFYFALLPNAAVDFIRHATHVMNRQGTPFRAKVGVLPALFERADCAVIYIYGDTLTQHLPAISAIASELAGRLRAKTPMFTLRLMPGVGYAQDPRGGRSFGYSRSQLLADVIIEFFRKMKRSPWGPDAIQPLRQRGYDPERLYLNPRLEPGGKYFATRA